MGTDRRTVDYILEQTADAGAVSARPMFGEFGLYCEGRMIAIVADDRLYLRPTKAGRAFAPEAVEAAPYPGAKPYLLIDESRWDDGEWLSELARLTAAATPLPKPKSPRPPKPRKPPPPRGGGEAT